MSVSAFARLRRKGKKSALLITPTSPHEVYKTKWLSANLGIERVAGYLRAHGHYAETFDTNLYHALRRGPSYEDKLRERDWDLIGFSVHEDSMIEDIGNMTIASDRCPDAILVAGGQAVTFDYQTILDKSPVKIVVLGEGEKPMLALAEGDPLEDIPGIVVKNYNVPLTATEFREATEAIDYEHIPYEKYWDMYLRLYEETGQAVTDDIRQAIHTIRIYARNYCALKCNFCSSTNFLSVACGRKAVPMADISGKDLVNLLKRIISSHPRVETIYFTDDDFCSRRNQLVEFLNLVIEERLPVTFIAFSRIDDLDEEIVALMVKARFRSLHMGIENFQPEILKEYNKKLNLETINKNIQLLNSYGIYPNVTFILCSPNAKLEWIENTTRRLLDEIEKGTIHPGVNVTVQPQKGSRFFEEYADLEAQIKRIPGTDTVIKRMHFIRCTDPEAREFQYRFLHRWSHYIDGLFKEKDAHRDSPTQAPLKLKMILDIIDEIKSERGKPDQFRFSMMSADERERLWSIQQKHSYGASL